MYGLVNNSIREMICEHYGADEWLKVKSKSEVDIDYFITNDQYEDSVTFKLATAASEVLDRPLSDVLVAFGEYWIIKTGQLKYAALMHAGGNDLQSFLINLPAFHNRISLIYPKLHPPEFKITDVQPGSVHVHYFSKRQGLQPFMIGLLQGLGKLYNTPCSIEILQHRDQGFDHEIFKVSW